MAGSVIGVLLAFLLFWWDRLLETDTLFSISGCVWFWWVVSLLVNFMPDQWVC